MQIRKLWRNGWPFLRWGLFFLLLGVVAAGLYVKLPPEPRWVLAGGPWSVFNSGDGWIATYPLVEGKATGPLQLWDAATGSEAGSFLNAAETFAAHAVSDDGRRIVALMKSEKPDVLRIRGVDLHQRREWQAETQLGSFTAAIFSPRCDFVVLRVPPVKEAGEFHTLVETSSGRTVAHLPGAAEQIVFGSNGGCVAASYTEEENRSEIRVVGTRTGKTSVIDDARFLAVSPDSHWIIGDRGDHGIWLWDAVESRWHARLSESKAQPAPHIVDDFVVLTLRRHRYASTVNYVQTTRRWRTARLWANVASFDVGFANDERVFSPDSRFVIFTTSAEPGQPQWTLHDVQTGKPLWKRTWETIPQEPLFTPDSRQIVVVRGAEQVEVLNAATGETERTMPLPGSDGSSARLTRDGRTLVVAATPPEHEPHWFFAKIEEWLAPRPDISPTVIRAYGLETGEPLGELSVEETDDHWLTNDRQSLVTVCTESEEHAAESTTIRGWDLPPRKPLRWVLSVPAALGVALLSLHFGWRQWRRRRVVASAPKPSNSA